MTCGICLYVITLRDGKLQNWLMSLRSNRPSFHFVCHNNAATWRYIFLQLQIVAMGYSNESAGHSAGYYTVHGFWIRTPRSNASYRTYHYSFFFMAKQRGRNPLYECSTRRRGRYLRSHNKQETRMSMPSAGFKPAIQAIKRPHTNTLDCCFIRNRKVQRVLA